MKRLWIGLVHQLHYNLDWIESSQLEFIVNLKKKYIFFTIQLYIQIFILFLFNFIIILLLLLLFTFRPLSKIIFNKLEGNF